jgi:hypothetical protein
MFGAERGLRRGDVLSGAFVGDIRAAGFDVIAAPTRNPRHARIVARKGSFSEEHSRELLALAFDQLEKVKKSDPCG